MIPPGPAVSPRHATALRLAGCTPDELLAFCRSSDDLAAWRQLATPDAPPPALTAAESELCRSLEAGFAGGVHTHEQLARQLAAMVFKPAFRLPRRFNVQMIPPELAESYIRALCWAPPYFEKIGDVDDFRAYFDAWISYTAIPRDGEKTACHGGSIGFHSQA
jgi:hypothetical protein